MRFEEFDLRHDILKGIQKMGFEEATEIQERAIPVALEGRDIIAQSQTGTGKTAAFALPIINKLHERDHRVQALILCPTRELAVQVAEAIKTMASKVEDLEVVAVYGGEPIVHQIRKLKRGAQIVVGTPGRMRDHLERRTIKAGHVSTLVLDEADEMLKMGFKEELEDILSYVPEERQSLLFSATFPKEVMSLANKYTENAEQIKIKPKDVTSQNIEQAYYLVKHAHKLEALIRLLDFQNPNQALIFCNTKREVDELHDAMVNKKVMCEKIHGDILQHARLDTIDRFNRGNLKLLIATDVAARGLDIDGVDIVYNYGVPQHPENYVHRIGRTGRAGREGISATLVSRGELNNLKSVERYIKMSVPKGEIPKLEDINSKRIRRYVDSVKEEAEKELSLESQQIASALVRKGYNPERIIAALINMNLEIDLREDINITFEAPSSNRGNDRNDRNSRSRGGSFDTLVIGRGKKDGLTVKNLLGFIYSKANVSKKDIGNIHITERETYLEVGRDISSKLLSKLNGLKMDNQDLNVRMKEQKSSGYRGKRKRK